MKYQDKLLSLIASKTDLDPQELVKEVVNRFCENVDGEMHTFINDCLKWKDEPRVLTAVAIARITEKVEEVVNEEESLCDHKRIDADMAYDRFKDDQMMRDM
jgi:hypothetical protein